MTRPVGNCVLCRGSLIVRSAAALERGRLILELPTGERFGWHVDCAQRDLTYRRYQRDGGTRAAARAMVLALKRRLAG